ncbi:FUSC family protein [Acinetobacter larvae]|uniref:Fusaric acid resistance protein n=1 Tax=Acinetobacter larvae TaxID=1789224 RepID=A0A1B2M0J8_9GAMM|nr:FUSC family protein [Acinetobacter larvae]AOA58710.1 hypothetical protein BFG52_10330 [Acinetobacter larvae]
MRINSIAQALWRSLLHGVVAVINGLAQRLDLTTARSAYIFRSILAGWLALSIAYALQLEMPYSAASTVLLVINPVQGAVVAKGKWRVIGTLLGMLVAFLLMIFFAQLPLLFICAFALWLAVCVAAMSVLRHFYATGAVVAGYTIGLALYGAMGHPQHSFEHILGRTSTVVIGVLCLSVVTMLLSRRQLLPKVQQMYRAQMQAVAQQLAAFYQHHANPSASFAATLGHSAVKQGHSAVVHADETIAAMPYHADPAQLRDIYGIDDVLAVAVAESKTLATRQAVIQSSLAHLHWVQLQTHMALPYTHPQLSAYFLELAAAWQACAADCTVTKPDTHAIQQQLEQAEKHFVQQVTTAASGVVDAHAHGRLIDLVTVLHRHFVHYRAALDGLQVLQQGARPGKVPRILFHRDYVGALRNGARAALCLFLAGILWLYSGWQYGDMMLLVVAPYCALLATVPQSSAVAGAWSFVKGTVYAIPAAWVCSFMILPHLSGLPLLLFVLAIFWLPGIYATSQAATGLTGLAYLVAFNTLAAVTNPMQYLYHEFLNFSLAWLLATLLVWLCFKLFLARDIGRDSARLLLQITQYSTAQWSLHKTAQSQRWQWLQQHRLHQLISFNQSNPQHLNRFYRQAMCCIELGDCLLQLRALYHSKNVSAQIKAQLAALLAQQPQYRPDSQEFISSLSCCYNELLEIVNAHLHTEQWEKPAQTTLTATALTRDASVWANNFHAEPSKLLLCTGLLHRILVLSKAYPHIFAD